MNTQTQDPSIPTATFETAEAQGQPRPTLEPQLEEALQGMVRIGALWARHGLEIGRGALHNSAATMEATASLLGALANTLRDAPEGARDESQSSESPTEGG